MLCTTDAAPLIVTAVGLVRLTLYQRSASVSPTIWTLTGIMRESSVSNVSVSVSGMMRTTRP